MRKFVIRTINCDVLVLNLVCLFLAVVLLVLGENRRYGKLETLRLRFGDLTTDDKPEFAVSSFTLAVCPYLGLKVTMHLQIDNFLQIWIFESKYWSKCDL